MSILKYKNPQTGQWEKVGIPTINVDAEIISHDVDTEAHNDIRELIRNITPESIGAVSRVEWEASMLAPASVEPRG